MGDPEEIQKFAEELIAKEKEDFENNRLRVASCCYTCPFCIRLSEKEPSGNPKCKCEHPAIHIRNLKIEINQYGFIPDNCPLRENSITIFLEKE